MIHITDFNGDIIDFISKSDGAVTEAEHMINVEDKLETFDFTVLTSRTEHMQKRNRVIIEDKDGQYREFIIYNISSDLNGYTRVQTNASALEDIKTAKPVAPNKLEKHTVKQALEYALADTGWEVSDEAEWGGTRTTSWTGWHDRISILKQLETTYGMRLSFYVEVGSNKITNRYVSLNKVEPMFNGEEIVYGDNMIGLKRTVDFSDIATALICLGPEDSETGKREVVEVKDDDAQAQFGLPYRYIWDIYEPQSSDENMTRKRLTTLGRTALNKRKQESVSYEIDGIGLSASAGDMIRVKNEDFTPELYVDAEVVEVTTDLISGESNYKFGVIKEYTRNDVYARFNAMLSGLRERLNKVVENTDSIISERLEKELKYVERYIEKSPTPPLNPKENQLWLDTSHDGVAVLKRYENGQWIKSSVDDIKDIGGMTREETMYEALKERLARNEVDYSEIFKRHGALVSEKHYHYVDEDIKSDLTNRYNAVQQRYDDFKVAFNNINAEQPTIGLITTAISRAVEFEARLKEYNDSYYVARKSFDEVIALLQSQYSDEKFNEAMQELAEQIGGDWNGNELIVDGKIYEKFHNVINELERQDNLLKNTIDETDYISGELTKSQSAIEQNSSEINRKVGYTEISQTNKTLEKLLTEFSQTSTGFNFKIDSNGIIQDFTIDKDRFKVNHDLIEFNDGDMIIKNGRTEIKDAYIDKLFSKNAFIEQLQAVDIDLNRATIHGGDSTNNIKLDHQSIMSYGTFTRSWGGERDTANLELGLYDGQMRMRNLDTGYRLYLTERGLSTSMEGAIDEFTSGTLEFHSQRFNKNSRGVTMHSSYGTVAMVSDYSTTVIRSKLTANIESDEYSVYVRPTRLTRNGLNEFAFYVKANDSTQKTDGTILFGDLTGANSSGSGIRFSKRRNLNTVYITNINGDIGTGDISVKDAEIRGSIRTIGGLDVRTWDGTGYNQLRAGAYNSYNSLVFASHSGGHSYFGVASNEMRVTDNNGYNGGNTIYRDVRMSTLHTHGGFQNHSGANYVYFGVGGSTGLRVTNNNLYNGGNIGWRDIEFRNWKANSHEKYKKDIKEWKTSVLDIFRNELQLYQYKYRDDLENNMLHRGIVLREDSTNDKFPAEWRQDDGYNGNEVMWWNTKAIQELAHENDELKSEIKELNNKIMEMIA